MTVGLARDYKQKTWTIKDWRSNDRPRERLLHSGVSGLSDAELLALLLRTGVRGEDAVSFSRRLLETFGGLRGLLSADLNKLRRCRGLGIAKASALAAVHEMSKRQLRESLAGRDVMREPQAVVKYCGAALRDKQKEVFKVIFLNKAHAVLADRDMFEGTIDEAAVYPREIVREALERNAAALILVHNHPSGRISPSPEDKALTEKVLKACEPVSVKILDHLIIAGDHYFSFKESGWL